MRMGIEKVWDARIYHHPYYTTIHHYCRMDDGSFYSVVFRIYDGWKYGGHQVYCRKPI